MAAPAPEARVMWNRLAQLQGNRGRPVELPARFVGDRDGLTPVPIVLADGRPRVRLSPAAAALFDRIDPAAVTNTITDPTERARWKRRFDEARSKPLLGLNECCRLLLGPTYFSARSTHAYNVNVSLLVDPAAASEWFEGIDRSAKWPTLADLMAPFRAEASTGVVPEPPGPDDDDDFDELPLDSTGLDPRLLEELRRRHEALLASGEIPTAAELTARYRRFRERFGPDILRGLDGERLLQAMHARRTQDSLVYWLEFKDDDEFPAWFGSIAGGSALKFGMYQRVETGDWWTGPPTSQVRLSLNDAITRARGQRDQLLAGVEVLEDASRSQTVDYLALQRRMEEVAPDVAETAWGHKYFALLFSSIVDDYHAVDYQQFQIVKLLRVPTDGRYSNAHYLIGAAREIGVPMATLGGVLNRRNGSPHKYWRAGTTSDGSSEWARMRDGSFVGIGWAALGDLTETAGTQEGKDALRGRFAEHWPGDPGNITRQSQEIFNFVTRAAERDIVVAMDGLEVRGIGVITGPYLYKPNDGPFAHRRSVRWQSLMEGRLPSIEQPRTTFRALGKRWDNLVEIERRVLDGDTAAPPEAKPTTASGAATAQPPTPSALPPLDGTVGRVHQALARKRQVILYGPPGTGKTYWADRAMRELAARSWFQKVGAAVTDAEQETLRREQAIQTCTFHASYGYEDFVEGYRPEHLDRQLTFQRRDGIFKQLCARAAKDPSHQFFLLIDEINRGDVPRIFGELLTVIERDKRGTSVTLPVSGEAFGVPDNVFVIGTMNTADRSIALLDAALRRRFAFVELMPELDKLAEIQIGGLPLGPWLAELNKRVVKFAGRDARHLQVGHGYLMAGGAPLRDVGRFAEVLRDDIIPLLEEYCYENYERLAEILGDRIVSRERQRVDDSLFEPQRHGELIEALLKSFDSITATAGAVAADAAGAAEQDDDAGETNE
jgi:5-methylcytosine-specific restriction protein B